MKKNIALFTFLIFLSTRFFTAQAQQADTTRVTLSFQANTMYFLNGLLLTTGDDDLKDLGRKWYRQANVPNPPTGSTVVTVQTDAETVFKLSSFVRQMPHRLISTQWNEIKAGVDSAAAGYQPLIERLSALDGTDANDRPAIRQAGKKDAQGKL
jgi:hypothetical protein